VHVALPVATAQLDVRRGVQNNVERDGASKVDVVMPLIEYMLARFRAEVCRSALRNQILVLGPWTGPRSTHDFVVAATEMDKAFAAAIEPLVDVEFMSLLYKPVHFKPSMADWKMQDKSDLVGALIETSIFDGIVLCLRRCIRQILVQIRYWHGWGTRTPCFTKWYGISCVMNSNDKSIQIQIILQSISTS
jgi:hypothetical protein